MSIPSHYTINVAHEGMHLFATASRSLPAINHSLAERVFNLFKEKFPEEEGYHVTMTRWDVVGRDVIKG